MTQTLSDARARRQALNLPYTHVNDFFIGGKWVPARGEERRDVTDPATNEVWGSVPSITTPELDDAVAAARSALPEWSALSGAQRAEYLLRIADEIEARADVLAATNTRENGSPISETRGAAANAAGIFRYFATLASWLDAEDVRPFPAGGAESLVEKDPIGVCGLIAPWNFPINLVVIKLAPALLAGSTVVIKPASPTPLSIRFIIEAVAAAGVPAGVVNLITGPGSSGDALVRHPDVNKIAFTGSTPVGRTIAAACGELLRPVTLELGGKSSAIVLPDADLDAMSSVLIRSCMRNTGQTCYISTRILAPASRYEEIVQMVGDTIVAAPQGDPLDETTVFGPVATRAQYDTVMGYLESAREEGARIVTGGGRASGFTDGEFIEPTVLADVTPEMTVAREEIFGPVITILRYDDSDGTADEAIALANNTEFGLGGLVFGADEDTALDVAKRVDSGSVGINFFGSNHAAPFGGRHDSGMGVEYGIEGLSAYLSYKSIHRKV
ncbi:aldehyde dehydrogenase family protein [Corynebacterium guangdongense]|uniref:Acyl-CoA reductase-like NAD-dependent aldehyde dehydrogenase n=1 Tax=Corynebacterium guangdongense TaxID=1783348 RepID=A0ABU1ZYS2_9CORY|nr:aldehyde dehydrogenase family protein [Corynebacterium guangdongense]MDR7330075.1 acyl-CoA reductase-like NAD-dependent aldehyde dehydrogenase [Corynebacterium guangdongense]WJZ18633.1 Geranial dehydrogenase [Corynebacterium guangdongense]